MSTGIELLVRVSLLLGAGTVIGLLLHRRSASLRHLVWSASLGGSLALAVMVPWAPRLDVRLKTWPPIPQPVPAAPGGSLLVNSTSRPVVVKEAATRIDDARAIMATRGLSASLPLWLVVWGGGSLVVFGWAAFGRLGLAVLTRRSARLSSGRWADVVAVTSARLGVAREIAIYQSSRVGAPMTWGTVRPVLLVPAESEAWSDELVRSVAAHEVAHVARRDSAMQLMAIVTCAAYWFHPLAWYAARRMRQAAERACDDQVLALGAAGEDYAAHLIGVARVSRQLRLTGAVAIGMARPSTLEGRIVSVLDPSQSREVPGARTRRLIALAAVVALIVAGTVRPVAASGVIAPTVRDADQPTMNLGEDSESGAIAPAKPANVPEKTPEAGVAALQGRDSVIERSFDVSPGGRLVLDLNTGGGVTVRGWDEDRVRVRAVLGGIDWRDVDVQIERESDGVLVATAFTRRRGNHSTSNNFEIMAPRRYDVRISSSGGGLTLIGLEGRFTGHTGGGELVLERLKGSARLTTGGGEIDVRDSDLSGSVSTGGGTVRISSVSGGLRGSSGSGPVIYGESRDRSSRSTTDISGVTVNSGGSRVSVGRDTDHRSGTLNIRKAGGDITLDAAPNGATVSTGGGDVRIGRSAGTVDAHTGGGDLTIGPVAGSVVAVTGAGDMRIIVDPGRGEQVVEATSGSGRIIVELPRDFDGRLELETAHTRTHEDRARIVSDWELDRDPLTDWENRYGTPRRFLRARAVLGRGTGRVVVRTVNGEIEIRRR